MFFNPEKVGRGFKVLKEVWTANKLSSAPEGERLRRIKEVLKDNPEIANALLIAGAEKIVLRVRSTFTPVASRTPEQDRARQDRMLAAREQALALQKADDAKIEAFDKIVEMLDHFKVGDKILGDCTKADLVKAAISLETTSREMDLRAAFYRQLSHMVGTGTVRESNQRGQIVGLLTATFEVA